MSHHRTFPFSLFLLAFALTGFALSLSSFRGCDFFIYDLAPVPTGIEPDVRAGTENITYVKVGLHRYEAEGNGCRKLTDDFDIVDGFFTAARTGNALAILLSLVATILILFEFLCCRFPCSRVLITSLLVSAFFSQSLTFLVYVSDIWCVRMQSYVNAHEVPRPV
jgi:hypothetical protein